VSRRLMECGIVDFEKKKSPDAFECLRRMKTILNPFENPVLWKEDLIQYIFIDLYDGHSTQSNTQDFSSGSLMKLCNLLPAVYFCTCLWLAEIFVSVAIHGILFLREEKNLKVAVIKVELILGFMHHRLFILVNQKCTGCRRRCECFSGEEHF